MTLGWVKEIDLSPHEELWGIEFQIFTFCSPVHYQEITKNSWAKPLRPAKPELISLFIILLQNDYRCLSVKWKTTNEGTSVTRLMSSETEKNERWTAKQRALHCAVPCATVFIDNWNKASALCAKRKNTRSFFLDVNIFISCNQKTNFERRSLLFDFSSQRREWPQIKKEKWLASKFWK